MMHELKTGFKRTVNWIIMNQNEEHKHETNI